LSANNDTYRERIKNLVANKVSKISKLQTKNVNEPTFLDGGLSKAT
jgi:hypothetical protein